MQAGRQVPRRPCGRAASCCTCLAASPPSQVAHKLGFQVPEDHLLPSSSHAPTSTLNDIAAAAVRSYQAQRVRACTWLGSFAPELPPAAHPLHSRH